jgi:hypothetical protein
MVTQERPLIGQALTQLHKDTFLSFFEQTGNNTQSCEAAGIDMSTLYTQWLKNDPAFVCAYNEAQLASNHRNIDKLEAECDRRALDKSDLLLMFRLKKLDNSYRDNPAFAPAGNSNTTINITVADSGQNLVNALLAAGRSSKVIDITPVPAIESPTSLNDI